MYSVFHFFSSLVEHKHQFFRVKLLEDFPFDETLLSCRSSGQFPDMAIRITPQPALFSGGELIELKDSGSYSIASFNSTIPTGTKEITSIIHGHSSSIKRQMEAAGDDLYALPFRDVYYLIRGQYKGKMKVLLVHGSFFETIAVEELISQSFRLVLEERLQESDLHVDDEIKALLVKLFSEQASFRKVRNIEKASVKLRFRIMTEVKAEGNILNEKKYPDILDDTLNLVVPCDTEDDSIWAMRRIEAVFGEQGMENMDIFPIKHHFNGYFLVFQVALR
jgi:hypothetical protein